MKDIRLVAEKSNNNEAPLRFLQKSAVSGIGGT
jgi:hypothetical protein